MPGNVGTVALNQYGRCRLKCLEINCTSSDCRGIVVIFYDI